MVNYLTKPLGQWTIIDSFIFLVIVVAIAYVILLGFWLVGWWQHGRK